MDRATRNRTEALEKRVKSLERDNEAKDRQLVEVSVLKNFIKVIFCFSRIVKFNLWKLN